MSYWKSNKKKQILFEYIDSRKSAKTLNLRRCFLTFRSWLGCQEAWPEYLMPNQQPIELVAVDFVALMLQRKTPLLQGQEGGDLCQLVQIQTKPLNKNKKKGDNQYFFKKGKFQR